MAIIIDLIGVIYQNQKAYFTDNKAVGFKPVETNETLTANGELTLQDILNLKTNIFKKSRVKLVRHKDNRKDYRELIKDKNELINYQKHQSKEIFKDCDYIISFVGQERKRSLLFGIFKVNGVSQIDSGYVYDLQELPEFSYLAGRIIIDWGENAIAWHQWYHKQAKEIIQILPKGYLGSFPGLLNFCLTFEELKNLVQHPEANLDWKNHLSAVNGIYLILDSKTGNQYIGSANGTEGIWQRWCNYAMNTHGGNKLLIDLCSKNPGYYKNFRYSILQTLPSNITQIEIVKAENLYKLKLGTRAFGLNSN